jgi:hypothetical protein
MIEVLKQMVEALEWCHGGEPIGTAEAIQAGKKAIAELESQEPVAWMDADGNTFPFVWNVSSLGVQQGSKYLDKTLTPLYAHPLQRTWVGLTDEEVRQMCGSVPSMKEAVREAEAKLKEKNT